MDSGWARGRYSVLVSTVLLMMLLLISTLANAAVSSSPFISFNGKIYSANAEAGSVSLLDAKSGLREVEQPLGRDIREVAVSDAGVALATSYLDGEAVLLDAASLSPKAHIKLGRRPYGVIYDAVHKVFWVTLFEDHQLVAINTSGDIVLRENTADTPRGLALTDDGRLLVSHAMTGQLSIYTITDVEQKLSLSLSKRIDLAVEQNPDQTVSQGLPRLLDDIAISPEGDRAWLPHVLWNFDHPFQFQSTVFPAVSVIDLTPGDEQELPEERKQLFEQINLLTSANRSEIVSNPFAAVFSADGNKVYVTLAGSEDLLVFDRSRRGKFNKKRHRSTGEKQGARATQLLRHLPGSNPRGLLIDKDQLLVQNAQSLDVTEVTTGGDGAFARARVIKPVWATLVEHDALSADQREGLRLFNLGNTQRDPEFPMAGDNWMSCQSCHLDGFNFTNKFLQDAHGQVPADNAITGHGDMKHMVSGDFLSEYIRMVKDTQGGFGHDDRDGAIAITPEAPEPKAKKMMEDLHRYVIASYNLPFLASWLRLNGQEQLPHPKEWLNSATCESCHQEIFDQWATSNHRLMGQSNPYYVAVLKLAEKTEGKEFGQWCQSCHMPQAVLSGIKELPGENHMLEREGESLKKALENGHPVVEEGTGCLFCHRVESVEDAGGNASLTVNLSSRESYLFESSDNALARWIGQRMINAKPAAHVASYSRPVYGDALYCKSCHDEFAPGTGSKIVNTWEEWSVSSYATAENPADRRTCISCHMNAEPGNGGAPVPGQATKNGPLKDNVYTHRFPGAQLHLAGLRDPELAAQTLALLKSATTLNVRREGENVVVRVSNTGAGHGFPTGVSDFREFWLEVNVWDADGNVLVTNGQLNARNEVPEDAHMFQKVFGDKEGHPVGLHFWRYAKLLKDTRIPADGYRDEAYPLPAEAKGPLTVEVKMQFRTYPQWITDVAKQQNPALTDPEVVTLERVKTTLN
ncbi:hypothetical protein ACKC9G_04435 [Pokkaliibacter sp. CJK22405]|uniref:hypothetical protein n=1 Tax=Pokkaliibacter sp. CJK22405 TaxID=3384615 RepID=UPI003984C663